MRQGCNIIKFDHCTAIVCGGELTDHKCNERSTIYEFSDGFRGTLFEKAIKEHINPQMCDEDKLYFLRQKDIGIRSASVACSICGRAAIDNAWYMYN